MSHLPCPPSNSLVAQLRKAGCVFAEEEAALITATARTPRERARMAERRSSGTPLEHVLGWARLHDLRLRVEPGVFVPRPRTEFLATEALARTRPGALGGRAHHGDLFSPLPAALRGRVDVVVVNAPYVPTERIALLPTEVRDHEPRRSLDGGLDGLDVVRRVCARARAWLAPRGHLLIQANPGQRTDAIASLTAGGLLAASVTCDDTDTCVVIGQRR
ncbi:putative protein N(5)-glutamine methyltransferase [Nocardiopsis sp. NPDC007018]|uniref:putative protein N(5)-glutamine methyltransferase n=1 Tax=Nocardiopsis sp. NPDC007018 TaxID=3155721 RepID=UPI00340FDEB0